MTNKKTKDGTEFLDDAVRLTRVGTFLRRWRIDELPQFINVFKGDMSLIGPRPFTTNDIDIYLKALDEDETSGILSRSEAESLLTRRHHVRPGMTGSGFISGFGGKGGPYVTPQEHVRDMLKCDVEYAEEGTLQTDFKIAISTSSAIFKRKSAEIHHPKGYTPPDNG